MRYLCMICYEQAALDKLSKSDFDAVVVEALAYDDELRGSGHYLYSGALQSIGKGNHSPHAIGQDVRSRNSNHAET